MKGYRIILSSLVLALEACQGLPSYSRSGATKDIAISDRLSDATIQANVGDEIRWTNTLLAPVRITFLDYVSDKLSCRRNFEGHFYSGADTDLQPHESASLCFYKPGTIRYVVRLHAELHNGEIVAPGTVQVGSFSGQPFTQNESAAVAPR